MSNFKYKGYILDANHQVQIVPIIDSIFWWTQVHLEKNNAATVGKTVIGDSEVSTVFLPIFYIEGLSFKMFETLYFQNGDIKIRKYDTWEEAKQGHEEIVKELKKGIQ